MLVKMAMRRSFEMCISMMVIATLTLAGCLGSGGGGSSVTATAPAQPTGVLALVGDAQVTVSWTASSGVTSYNIYYAAASGVTTSNGTKAASLSSPHVISNLVNDTPYHFVVTAVNAAGESTVSSEVTATPVAIPAKPSGIVASGGDGKVTVSWTASTGATSYNVYYATASGVTTSGTRVASASSPAVITNLTNNTPYYFVVTAVNAAGESSVSSEKTATPAATPQAPGSPTGVTVTSTVAGQATVSWTASPNATSYNVYYLPGTSAPTTATVLSTGTIVSSSSLSVDIPGLTSGSTYYFNVTAVNAGGESSAQNSPKSKLVK